MNNNNESWGEAVKAVFGPVGRFVSVIPHATLKTLVIGIQFLGVTICSFLAYAFIGRWLGNLPGVTAGWVLFTSFGLGTISWAAVLFKTPVLTWLTINVKPPYRVLLSNQFKSSSLEGKDGKIDTRSLREISWGWNAKCPWEISVEAVDMQAGLLIGNSVDPQAYDPLKVYPKDGSELHVGWRTRLTALPGYLRNHYLYTDIEQITYFRAFFTEFLIGWFSTMENAEQAFAELNKVYAGNKTGKDILSELFRNVLGGKEIHPIEKERGMFSGEKPEITGIVRSEATQKIKQSKMATKAIAENTKLFERSFSDKTVGKLNPNLALITAAKAAGVDVDAEVFVGLEGLDPRAIGVILGRNQQKTKGGK